MFKKLVSNLPFNPSLISEIGFYTDRLKKERSVRRISFLFIAATMVIQIIAVAAPPQRSLASSSNHIIDGIRTKSDILNAWDQPGSDIPAIYGLFGVTRKDIRDLTNTPNATIKTGGDRDYWSIGRNSLTGYSGIDQKFINNQVPLQYGGADTNRTGDDQFIYQRQLSAWDIRYPTSTYTAFKGTSSATGKVFWILVDCGNLTTLQRFTPPATPQEPEPKPPKGMLDIRKSIVDNPSNLKPGDSLTYRIEYRNSVPNSLAEGVYIEDQFDIKNVEVVKPLNAITNSGFYRHKVGSLGYTKNYKVLLITVKLKDQISSGSSVCNTATITSTNTKNQVSNNACIGVITPCPFDSTIANANNPNCTEPKIVCTVVDAAIDQTTRKVSYKTTVSSSNPTNTTVKRYSYDYGDNTTEDFNSNALTHQTMHTYGFGTFNTTVTIFFQTTGQSEIADQSVNCTSKVEFVQEETPPPPPTPTPPTPAPAPTPPSPTPPTPTPTPTPTPPPTPPTPPPTPPTPPVDQPLGQSKTVKNITQNKDGDAVEESTLKANDVLQYTLSTANSQNYERSDIEISDYIGDILDYAILDKDYLAEQGGTYDAATKKIIWSGVTLAANSTVSHSFKVKIKDPIPATNSPSNVSSDFDCKISNQYGNEITINIGCPLVKGIETLPNTGPGSSMIAVVGITTTVGYFFARSRLLAKEIGLVKKDFVATGGI